MRVDVPVSWTEHETGSELERILAQAMLPVPGCASSRTRCAVVPPKNVQHVCRLQFSGLVSAAFFIYQQWERDSGFFPEQARIGEIAQADSGQLRTCCFEFILVLAQLRDVLTAEDSSVMTKENYHRRALLPQRPEAQLAVIGIRQCDRREPCGEGGHRALRPGSILLESGHGYAVTSEVVVVFAAIVRIGNYNLRDRKPRVPVGNNQPTGTEGSVSVSIL